MNGLTIDIPTRAPGLQGQKGLSMYIRKTRDRYDIEVNYGFSVDNFGWDVECSEYDIASAKKTAKEYRENTLRPVRIKKRREKIS